MGCNTSKDELPYYETRFFWYFCILDGQVMIARHTGIISEEAIAIHTEINDKLEVINTLLHGSLTRAIDGIGKIRTGKGVLDHPLTVRINAHYEKQRTTCIELIEDVINTFSIWEDLSDDLKLRDRRRLVREVTSEYTQRFVENRREYTENHTLRITWENGGYVSHWYVPPPDRQVSNRSQKTKRVVTYTVVQRSIPTYRCTFSKKPLRERTTRSRHGDKCVSRTSVRRNAQKK